MNKEIYGYIYCISNIHNNKKYVGQIVAWKGKNRLLEHYRQAHYGYYPITKFRNALRKYSLEDFHAKTIDLAYSQEELNEKEKYWIKKYDSFNNGYNSTLGGDGGCAGYKHTEEAKKKIAENNRKRKLSQESKNKIGKANHIKLLNRKDISMPIDMYDYYNNFLKSFPSIREAKRFLNIDDDSSIRQILKGNLTRKRLFGFTFKYHKKENIKQILSDEDILKLKEKQYLPINTLVYKVEHKNGKTDYVIKEKGVKDYTGKSPSTIREHLKKHNNIYNNCLWTKIKPNETPNDYPIGSEE